MGFEHAILCLGCTKTPSSRKPERARSGTQAIVFLERSRAIIHLIPESYNSLWLKSWLARCDWRGGRKAHDGRRPAVSSATIGDRAMICIGLFAAAARHRRETSWR
jgi:hypothetical protein